MKVGILGGGISGVTTATAIRENYRDAEILLYSPESFSHLVSYGAPACFRPDPSKMPAIKCCMESDNYMTCIFHRWCMQSKSYFWSIASSSESSSAGVFFQPMMDVYDQELAEMSYSASLCGPSSRWQADELCSLGFADWIRSGNMYTTCMIEGQTFIPYLLSKLNTSAFSVCKPDCGLFNSPSDVSKWAIENKLNAVINCTGLGSALLFNDVHLKPVKGHLVEISAPWMKFGQYGPTDSHAFVRQHSVVLGALREQLPSPLQKPLTAESFQVSPEVSKAILQRAAEMWHGPLSKAPIIGTWTGLRPHRDLVRIELDWLCEGSNSRPIPLIHNYGHGAMGYCVSRGTAMDVVYLVDAALKCSKPSGLLLPPGLEQFAIS